MPKRDGVIEAWRNKGFVHSVIALTGSWRTEAYHRLLLGKKYFTFYTLDTSADEQVQITPSPCYSCVHHTWL